MYTILLVDNDMNICNVIADYLVLQGFRVYVVNSVNLALCSLCFCKPDIIITDIMIGYITGYDLIKIVRLDYRYMTIPFIFLTVNGMMQDRIYGYNLGCNLYMTKPFNPKELCSIIKTIIEYSSKFKLNINNLHSQNFSRTISSDKNNIALSFTSREKTVLKFILQGYTNKEIAIQLNLSVRNIEKYISQLLYKTYARNRTDLVVKILSLNISIDLL